MMTERKRVSKLVPIGGLCTLITFVGWRWFAELTSGLFDFAPERARLLFEAMRLLFAVSVLLLAVGVARSWRRRVAVQRRF
jgi:hypothetical protein